MSLPVFLMPEVEAHLAEFVGQAPDAYVFLGPKGAHPARSNFHTIWDKARQPPRGARRGHEATTTECQTSTFDRR